MNIFVEELPEIPYDIIKKYVHGSPAGHVTVSGKTSELFFMTIVHLHILDTCKL